jgi:hypothetical protein
VSNLKTEVRYAVVRGSHMIDSHMEKSDAIDCVQEQAADFPAEEVYLYKLVATYHTRYELVRTDAEET